jgi:tyrosinase-like protein
VTIGDGIRRNVAEISQAERDRLRDAFLALDTSRLYPDNVSVWDKQEEIHKNAHEGGADVHFGPAFLSWHRELCNRFEAALRQVDPNLSLHYWDWTTDPRASDNGAGGTTNLLSPQFMGSASGDAGVPLQTFESTEDAELHNGHTHIWRDVSAGAPPIASDHSIVTNGDTSPQGDQFIQMNSALQGAHNVAHGYIGGTLAASHYSFHDPFVFLLHSNVDRLWGTWQRASGHSWRLDPNQTYGAAGTAPSIVADLQPWAGDIGTSAPPLRPWTGPDNQELVKTSTDPSVVAPRRYDTSPSEDLQLVGLIDGGGMWHTIRYADGSWQRVFGDVKGVESNDPGFFSAVACAGVNDELQLAGLTDGGGMWHTIRHADGSWQPFFGDVKGVESNDPGHFSAIGCAGVNDELQVVGLTDGGGMWHTIRHVDSWQPSFGDVKGVESNDPGHFSAVACAAVGGSTSGGDELHLIALTDAGGMWHTIRRADGSWQPSFGDVKGVESNDPGFFSAVGCAGIGGDLHVVALTDAGGMWHTIRRADGTWQPSFGDVKGVESNDPGHFSAVACGAVNGDLQVVALTDAGGMWHTIRHPDGSWQPSFGDVKGVESNDPGHFSAVGCTGVA